MPFEEGIVNIKTQSETTGDADSKMAEARNPTGINNNVSKDALYKINSDLNFEINSIYGDFLVLKDSCLDVLVKVAVFIKPDSNPHSVAENFYEAFADVRIETLIIWQLNLLYGMNATLYVIIGSGPEKEN